MDSATGGSLDKLSNGQLGSAFAAVPAAFLKKRRETRKAAVALGEAFVNFY